MKAVRIVGQTPKLRDAATGRFIDVARNGHVLRAGEVLQVSRGGGFDEAEQPEYFRTPGTVVRWVREGDPRTYAITEVSVPDAESAN